MNFKPTLDFAVELDKNDSLNKFRSKFLFPKTINGKDCLYFTGNSLGLQPTTTREYINQELDDWAKYGVEGHFHAKNPWMPYHEFVTDGLAYIAGAKSSEVVAMNTLTTNLHLLMVSFYRPSGKKRKILCEYSAFPSDFYALKSQIKFHGGNPETDLILMQPDAGSAQISTESLLATIEENADELALVMLGGVNYYTGQAFDMQAITAHCHKHNIIAGFDLAHAAGNLILKLHDWNVDFAAWCSYKYLNSGPGGIAGIFVHEKHHNESLPRFEGWWGHDKSTRFKMDKEFIPIQSAEAWQLSNPPIFQLAALRASLEIFQEAGMENLRTKSEQLTAYFEFLINSIDNERIEIISPKNLNERGCQLSIRVINADKSLFDKISSRGVIADWREPDVIRMAPVPLYNSYEDIYNFYEILKSEMWKP